MTWPRPVWFSQKATLKRQPGDRSALLTASSRSTPSRTRESWKSIQDSRASGLGTRGVYTESVPRPTRDPYESNGGRRDALGVDHALIWRGGEAAVVPLVEASALELESGVASVEAVAISIVDRYCRRSGVYLSEYQREDAVAHLIAAAWFEARRYDPLRVPAGPGRRFSNYVVGRIRWRFIDWLRLTLGRESGMLVSMETIGAEIVAPEKVGDDADPFEVLGVVKTDLSLRSQWTLLELAWPLSRGERLGDVCSRHLLARRTARGYLDSLREELATR
jgi:hypothetical protein